MRGLAHAAIDVSDGLTGDLGHILERSQVGAALDYERIPRPAALRSIAEKEGNRALERDCVLSGGDDYELLFAARPRTSVPCNIVGVPVTQIGRITRQKQMRLVLGDGSVTELKPRGWEHFGRASTR